jgi:hypothetical protein
MLTSRNVDAMHLSPTTKKVLRYSANAPEDTSLAVLGRSDVDGSHQHT